MAMNEVLNNDGLQTALATMPFSGNSDVLARRYATEPMKRLYSEEGNGVLERYVQIQVMRFQSENGVDIPADHIDDYQHRLTDIDIAANDEIEARTKHDVNARITVFNDQAGHQNVGEAMTSRDHTDNAEQFQKRLAFEILRPKILGTIASFAVAAATYAELPITGRTHNVVAQMTTLGKRFASTGEELLDAYKQFAFHVDNLKLRGIKGAVGTQQDILDLFEGDESKVDALDEYLAEALGFSAVYNSVGQIYPRSQDLAGIQALSHVVGPLSNFGTNVRHMMGGGLMRESTRRRVGSNAMPHKINPRTVERIVGLYGILGGFEMMLRPKAGEQWLEGDVSDSVIRRVAIPGSFFAADGALEAGANVLRGFGLFEQVINAEIDRSLPFLATTKVLTTSINRGVGREDAHERIRQHAFDVVEAMQEGQVDNDLLHRLGNDPEIPMSYSEILEAIDKPLALSGRAATQAHKFARAAEELVRANPQAVSYQPGDIR